MFREVSYSRRLWLVRVRSLLLPMEKINALMVNCDRPRTVALARRSLLLLLRRRPMEKINTLMVNCD